jgi:hypothetical protein
MTQPPDEIVNEIDIFLAALKNADKWDLVESPEHVFCLLHVRNRAVRALRVPMLLDRDVEEWLWFFEQLRHYLANPEIASKRAKIYA